MRLNATLVNSFVSCGIQRHVVCWEQVESLFFLFENVFSETSINFQETARYFQLPSLRFSYRSRPCRTLINSLSWQLSTPELSIKFSAATDNCLVAISSQLFNCYLKRLSQLLPQPAWDSRCITSGRTQLKTPSIVSCVFVATGMCLRSRCPAMNIYSGSTIPAFRRYVTVHLENRFTHVTSSKVWSNTKGDIQAVMSHVE
jgi:hypothetical protein